jgi:hypothetical protein
LTGEAEVTVAQIIGPVLGLLIIASLLWKVLRRPRHEEGNHEAWWSGGEADGTGPGD